MKNKTINSIMCAIFDLLEWCWGMSKGIIQLAFVMGGTFLVCYAFVQVIVLIGKILGCD